MKCGVTTQMKALDEYITMMVFVLVLKRVQFLVFYLFGEGNIERVKLLYFAFLWTQIVIYEAARALVNLKNLKSRDLCPAISGIPWKYFILYHM